MGKRSRNKGAGYERKVAKLMTDWWGGQFSRVPASGGLNWGSDQRVAGDIVPPPESEFPFVIECKKQEGWTFDHIALDISAPREWWSQVVMDSRRVSRVPLLIFSRNHAKDFIMIPYEQNMVEALNNIENDVTITWITIKNIRDEIQVFKVLTTTFTTFSQLDKKYIQDYAKDLAWDPYSKEYET